MYIFDLDGTLIDSNSLWLEVDDEFLARRGLVTTTEYQELVGRAIFPTAAEYTREYYGLEESPESIMAEWELLADHHYRHLVELKPGARDFLRQCRAEGRGLTLFTACRPALCRVVMERFDLESLFDHVVFAEEIGLEKHDPRCFVRLSRIIGVPPEKCTLFDDSCSNCATARAAGMETVGVYDSFYEGQQEALREICHRCIRSFGELLEQETL